jgi:hypothetical protein
MMAAVSTSETSINFYQITWCNNKAYDCKVDSAVSHQFPTNSEFSEV